MSKVYQAVAVIIAVSCLMFIGYCVYIAVEDIDQTAEIMKESQKRKAQERKAEALEKIQKEIDRLDYDDPRALDKMLERELMKNR